MFTRRLRIERIERLERSSGEGSEAGEGVACPIAWIDNFAMRNFTNHAVFDDTLPVADGLMEAGFRVPISELAAAMEDWFRRKGYLKAGDALKVTEFSPSTTGNSRDAELS